MQRLERTTTDGHIALWMPGADKPLGFYKQIDSSTILACKPLPLNQPVIRLFDCPAKAESWIAQKNSTNPKQGAYMGAHGMKVC